MSRIHVLHVLNSAHGGSALSTLELIKGLREMGINSSLICFNNATDDQQMRINGLVDGRSLFIPLYWMNKKIRTAFWKRPILEILSIARTHRGNRFQKQIDDIIRANGVTLIHTSTILNPEGAIAARRNNLPHLWHVRELVGPSKHFHFHNYPAWTKYVASHCEYLIANSSITAQCLEQFFPKDKIKCIPNGIDIQKFSIKKHIPSERIVIGMVGSVTTRWKNHEFFIRVAAQFRGEKSVEFRIYGALPPDNDPYLAFLRNLVQSQGVEDVVTFSQFASPNEIMSEIDVLFHPSRFESFGRIFVEAMAGGIPVVAVQEGGALEMVQHGVNGFLVKNGDAHSGEKMLRELMLNSDLRNKLGSCGRKLVESKYTIDILLRNIIDLYKAVTKPVRHAL
jgi:glycosyltransferase involved in cell wall biosynthesis